MSCHNNQLSVLSFGLAAAVVWGLGVFLVGLMATYMNYGQAFVEVVGSVYPGYKATLCGSAIGGLWAIVDGFVAGAIFAFVYNIGCKCCKKCCPSKKSDASQEQV